MVEARDIIHLPCTGDLLEAGSAYACRSLATARSSREDAAESLLRTAAHTTVELALRRKLRELAVPFRVIASRPFTSPDHYDILLREHPCRLVTYLISDPQQVRDLSRDAGGILGASALIASEEFVEEGRRAEDVYLFAFLVGGRMQMGAEAGGCLVHPLPEGWARPVNWAPMKDLAVKSEDTRPLGLELGGLDAKREFAICSMEISPMQRVEVGQDFYSLAYVRANTLPEGRLGLHCSLHRQAVVVKRHEWENIQAAGRDILLAGWLSQADFRRKCTPLNIGTATFQFRHTHLKNLAVPVTELNPPGELFEWARAGGEPTIGETG